MERQGKTFILTSIGTIAGLIVVPVVTLGAALVQSDRWADAMKALQGEYVLRGTPYNPWPDFLSGFLPILLATIALAVIGFIVVKRFGSASPLGYVKGGAAATLIGLLILLTSTLFSVVVTGAWLFPQWFHDGPALSSPLRPSLFKFALVPSSFVLFKIYFWLIPDPKEA